jgi:hypothetical protein
VYFTFSRPNVKQRNFWQFDITMHIPIKVKGTKLYTGPPFRSSSNIMGFSTTSNPSARRTSGGKVMDPRFETGIAVILQNCIAV